MQRFGDLTGEVPPSLGEADTAMRDAAQALADGRDEFASAAEQRAIEALQKGNRDMGQSMARQFGTGEQPGDGEAGEGEGEGEPGAGGPGTRHGDQPGDMRPGGQGRRTARRDPLGREFNDGNGPSPSDAGPPVPGTREQLRTQGLQEELRRRGADRTRPKPELDYIDRLLKDY